MFIHFFCLCPLSLTFKLTFNISKVAYWSTRRTRSVCETGRPKVRLAKSQMLRWLEVWPTWGYFLTNEVHFQMRAEIMFEPLGIIKLRIRAECVNR